MNISFVGFKDKADYDRQISRYHSLMAKRKQLEWERQDAEEELARTYNWNVKPLTDAQVAQSDKQKRDDQVQLFMVMSKELMTPDEASKFTLNTDTNTLRLTNLNWETIVNKLKDQKPVSANDLLSFVNTAFSKYSNDYVIPASIQMGQVQAPEDTPNDLLTILKDEDSFTYDDILQKLKIYLKDTYTDLYPDIDTKKGDKVIRDIYEQQGMLQPGEKIGKQQLLNIIKYEISKVNPSRISAVTYHTNKATHFRPYLNIRTTGGRVFFGKGLSQNESRYGKIGKYYIHIPSLKRNIINIKYKSLASIDDLPKVIISNDLKTFIMDIIDTGKMDNGKFQNLEDNEKRLLCSILRKAECDEGLGLKNYQTDDDKEMERFRLLQAEIIAGNNNVDLIKQLKRYIFTFLKDNRLTKREAFDMLAEISCLV